MRTIPSSLLALAILLPGCSSTPDANRRDTGPTSTETPAPAVSDFKAAAFGTPWSFAGAWLPDSSAGAAYRPGEIDHLIHHDPVSLDPPLIAIATYTPSYQAWQAYCSGQLAVDDSRISLLMASSIPDNLRETCFVSP